MPCETSQNLYVARMNARLAVTLALACLLAACGPSAGERAERSYEMVKKTALDRSEVCRAARAAREAWLSEGNMQKYEIAEFRAYSDCARP